MRRGISRWLCGWVLCGLPALLALNKVAADDRLSLDDAARDRCLRVLREGLQSDEFWPSMHAAEALSLAGHGAEVREKLLPLLPAETDDQRRCGLARELVRAGDLAQTQVMLEILAGADPHGHVHACESLYKVKQIGDGELLRAAMLSHDSTKALMAAAALSRWGSPQALELLRRHVVGDDPEVARIAAWILARTGETTDIAALRAGAAKFNEPLIRAYFQHALAARGDAEGSAALIQNLRHGDPAVRVYACEFAPEARLVDAGPLLLTLLDDDVLDVRVRAAQALLQLAGPPPETALPFQRDVFPATDECPRYSEGSLLVLSDNRLLFAVTEFHGSESDFAEARIIAAESVDAGRTWAPPRVLQENIGKNNVMSATLRRLRNDNPFGGPIGFFYLVKNSVSDLHVQLRVSHDEAASFGEPVQVTNTPGYHVLNNDRVTVLPAGRLIVPVASTEDVRTVNRFESSCWLSDDEGQTWRSSRNAVSCARRGAMEPEVVRLHDGRLLMHVRTQLGHIAVSESEDGGETWSPAKPWTVRAPEAPSTLRRIPSTGDLLLIWNDTFTEGAGHGGRRTPLTAAISRDEGRTWEFKRQLETSTDHTFAYCSVTFHQGRALLTYYVRDERTGRISSRFRSLPIGWFYSS
jgi:sialidase-1